MIVYAATALVFLVYLVAAWFLGSLLGLQGRDLWILRGGLGLIGLAASVVFIWFHIRISKQKAAAAGGSGVSPKYHGSEIDAVIREAEVRLKSSLLGRGANLKKLPVVFLLGDLATGKTSVMVHSGLDAELLAGQVYEDKSVAPIPTRSANLWYTRNTAFLETSSKTFADRGLWSYMLSRLERGKISSLKGGHPPRAAVVCVSCDTFVQSGGNNALETAALDVRHIRTCLEEVARILGISFPVYVLFTKADRIPFFTEFTRNLSNDEATQVLGVTLPLRPGQDVGVYAEQETQRLNATFNNLVLSLADKRPALLAREHDSQKLGGIYEFPREIRKLRSPIVQFLADLCRPSQLKATPFLRGFYFSGVRPVFVNEVAQPAVQPQRGSGAAFNPQTDATRIFKADRPAMEASIPQPQVVGTRKVPQWTFLSHFFSDVLLQDRLALTAASASVKTNSLRRILLATGAAVCLLLSIAFVISYFGNRALEAEVSEASMGVSTAGSSSAVPLAGKLAKLETLRQSLEKLSAYRRGGAPWRLRWGLFVGTEVNIPARSLYFKQFRNLLFESTQTALLDFLKNVPPTPRQGDDYGLAYDSLKAYLITTSNHDKSSQMFLSPVLLKRWAAGRNPDAETQALAQKQFDFYSEELITENPYSSENDSFAIERARRYVSQFAGTEPVYQYMLAEASRKNSAANFSGQYPKSVGFVTDNREVAGAYTKTGWAFMQDAIKNADRFFSGEKWVLGEQGTVGIDRTKLEQQLKERYTTDYIEQWQQFLRAASVVRYTGVKDASAKLNVLAGNQSPLLQLFCMVSRNTGVETPQIKSAFQPVQFVVAPTCGDQFIGESNSGYMQSLLALDALLEQIGNSPGTPNPALTDQALSSASQAKIITKQLAQKFQPDPQNHTDATVQKLMEDPITFAETAIRSMGPAELNAKGKAFCSQFSELAVKYPFNSSNTARQATLQDLNLVFQRPQGAFWIFYEMNLRNLLDARGGQFVVKEGSPIMINPAFLNFWNRAALFADAMYADSAFQPRMVYTLRPYRVEGIEASLTIDGKTITTSGPSTPQQFIWTGNQNSEVKLSGTIGQGTSLPSATFNGTWAVFQLVASADKQTPISTGYTLEWYPNVSLGRGGRSTISSAQTAIRFDLEGKGAAVMKNSLGSCVSEIAR